MAPKLKSDKDKLIEFDVPKEMAEKAYSRVEVFLRKYHEDQAKWSARVEVNAEFDLKSLVISCYTQGLQDAVEISKTHDLTKLVPHGNH